MDRRTLFHRLVGHPGWSVGLLWLAASVIGTMWLAHAARDTGIRCPADVEPGAACAGYQTGSTPLSWLVIAVGLVIVVRGLAALGRWRRQPPRCALCDAVNPRRAKFCGNCGTRLYG